MEDSVCPERIGEIYINLKQIGSGGFGKIYQCFDTTRNQFVAIKKIPRNDDEQIKREEEVANKLQVNPIPNVVSYRGVIKDQTDIFIIMDYYPLGDLQVLIELFSRIHYQISEDFVLVVGSQIVNGLYILKQYGLAHRDVKPSNIFMDSEGNFRLGDFGLVKGLNEGNKNVTTTVGGSPGYAPPEMVKGEQITMEADVYSLGCVLYALIVGKPPYHGETIYKYIVSLEKHYTPIPQEKKISSNLCELIKRMCDIKPENRPTIDELRTSSLLSKTSSSSSSSSSPQFFYSPSRGTVDDIINKLNNKVEHEKKKIKEMNEEIKIQSRTIKDMEAERNYFLNLISEMQQKANENKPLKNGISQFRSNNQALNSSISLDPTQISSSNSSSSLTSPSRSYYPPTPFSPQFFPPIPSTPPVPLSPTIHSPTPPSSPSFSSSSSPYFPPHSTPTILPFSPPPPPHYTLTHPPNYSAPVSPRSNSNSSFMEINEHEEEEINISPCQLHIFPRDVPKGQDPSTNIEAFGPEGMSIIQKNAGLASVVLFYALRQGTFELQYKVKSNFTALRFGVLFGSLVQKGKDDILKDSPYLRVSRINSSIEGVKKNHVVGQNTLPNLKMDSIIGKTISTEVVIGEEVAVGESPGGRRRRGEALQWGKEGMIGFAVDGERLRVCSITNLPDDMHFAIGWNGPGILEFVSFVKKSRPTISPIG